MIQKRRTTAILISPVLVLALSSAVLARAQPLSITYFIGEGKPEIGYRASDRQLAIWALGAWQRNSDNRIHFDPAPESAALIRVYWAGPNDLQYGETRPIDVGGRRGAAVFIRPDTESLGDDIAPLARRDALLRDTIVYLTCLHELGHALGFGHTSDFRDIMYFFGYGGNIAEYFGRYRAQLKSRNDIATVSGLSDADIQRLRSEF